MSVPIPLGGIQGMAGMVPVPYHTIYVYRTIHNTYVSAPGCRAESCCVCVFYIINCKSQMTLRRDYRQEDPKAAAHLM